VKFLRRFLSASAALLALATGLAATAKPPAPAEPGHTLAHALLTLELEGTDAPLLTQGLNQLVEHAVARFGRPAAGELEPATAARFFRQVDESLVADGVIFPPAGRVELLRDALQPRQPADDELQRTAMNFANARRATSIAALRRAGEPLYYFDCDLTAVLYVAVAERLALPVFLVEAPDHNFVRWQSPGVSLNWDPNDGAAKSDQYFAQVAGITAEDRATFGYLENRSPARIQGYWLVRRGQRKAADGNAAGALADFREAVKTAPDDPAAANELAWLLATAPDALVRNGREAREMAEKLVARSRRINWLETLAAAWAETGDFPQAIAVEEEARRRAESWLQAAYRSDSLAGFDTTLAVYRQNLSYAAGKNAGLIK